MSYKEVMVWVEYRKKYGPANDVRRYDRPAALISWMASQALGGKATMQDFMPFGKEETISELTPEELKKAFGHVNIVRGPHG